MRRHTRPAAARDPVGAARADDVPLVRVGAELRPRELRAVAVALGPTLLLGRGSRRPRRRSRPRRRAGARDRRLAAVRVARGVHGAERVPGERRVAARRAVGRAGGGGRAGAWEENCCVDERRTASAAAASRARSRRAPRPPAVAGSSTYTLSYSPSDCVTKKGTPSRSSAATGTQRRHEEGDVVVEVLRSGARGQTSRGKARREMRAARRARAGSAPGFHWCPARLSLRLPNATRIDATSSATP